MPATFTTKEVFPGDTPITSLQTEVALRIKAGAIRASVQKEGESWVLTTEWNVVGEND